MCKQIVGGRVYGPGAAPRGPGLSGSETCTHNKTRHNLYILTENVRICVTGGTAYSNGRSAAAAAARPKDTPKSSKPEKIMVGRGRWHVPRPVVESLDRLGGPLKILTL